MLVEKFECRNLLWESGGLWLDVLFLIVVLLYVGGEVVGIYGGYYFLCVWLRMGGGWLLEDSFGLGFGVFCGVCFLRFGFCGLGVETVGVL